MKILTKKSIKISSIIFLTLFSIISIVYQFLNGYSFLLNIVGLVCAILLISFLLYRIIKNWLFKQNALLQGLLTIIWIFGTIIFSIVFLLITYDMFIPKPQLGICRQDVVDYKSDFEHGSGIIFPKSSKVIATLDSIELYDCAWSAQKNCILISIKEVDLKNLVKALKKKGCDEVNVDKDHLLNLYEQQAWFTNLKAIKSTDFDVEYTLRSSNNESGYHFLVSRNRKRLLFSSSYSGMSF